MKISHSVLLAITVLSFSVVGWTYAADKKPTAPALEEASEKPAEEVGISISQLQKDLEKNEKSLEITKQKKKEVKGETFLPDLYFVLSDLYNEKARLQYLLTRARNPKTPMNELDFSDSKQSKKMSLESLQTFIDNFPKNPDLDKAYFNMAQTYRELGLDEDMVKTQLKIISDFPQSKFWEQSQLTLGDYFLEQKKDPLMAKDFYQKILERKENPFMPLARYKLGWCYINLNKFYEAMVSFESVITVDKNFDPSLLPDVYRKSDVKKDALLNLVWPYSEQKTLSPERANPLAYFERLSPSRSVMVKVYARLAKRLLIKLKIDLAIPVYLRLLEMTYDPSSKAILYEEFYDAYKKSKLNWDISGLAEEFSETLMQLRNSDVLSAADMAKQEKNFEVYVRDFSTKLHSLAKISNRRVDFEKALSAYESFLYTFPKSKYTLQILVNQAEAYYSIRSYARAGLKYELISRRSKKKKDYWDSSIQSYAFALKNSDKLSKLELTESREGFREVGSSFIKTYPNDKANSMILFNIARTYYDDRDFYKAVQYFKSFINSYPRQKEVTMAGQLILDSFNQQEDYDGMIKSGKEIVSNPNIDNVQFKKDINELVKQAEYRKIQVQVGDPKSRDYATKLLGFAQKYQGSSIGDQALFEAFTSLKLKKDPQAYDPGEQLLLKHEDSKYAKEVTASMGQMAMNTADYKRAAKYFEVFARKYPQDPNSNQLLQTSAQLREYLGDYKEAAESYRALGDRNLEVAKQFVMAQDWSSAAQSLLARPSGDLRFNYWLGLSLYRQGQFDQAKIYLANASRQQSPSYEEKTMIAHSLYLVASIELKQYQSIQLGTGQDEAALVKQKTEKLKELTNLFEKVISYGNGRWTIASLYEMGRANDEFANFISNATIPAGLSDSQKQQYKTLIDQQSNQYRNKSKNFYKNCVTNAEKFDVFTFFVKGCSSMGSQLVDESNEQLKTSRSMDISPSESLSVRKKLFDNPRDPQLLLDLALVYIKAGDYKMSIAILNRVLEINRHFYKAQSWMGIVNMYLNDYETAHENFKQALKINKKDPLAVYGLASLYKQFAFLNKFKTYKNQAIGLSLPKGPIHPWMANL